MHPLSRHARGLSLLATALSAPRPWARGGASAHGTLSTATVAGLCLALAVACDGPMHLEPGGITLVAGAPQTDSVEAFLAQPLVVEVRDQTGSRTAGLVVRFSANVEVADSVERPTAYLSPTPDGDFTPTAEAVTDATGRAVVRVRLGRVVGPAEIGITVPALGYSSGARFQVNPGVPASVKVSPQDTAVYVGGSYALRVVTEDRLGNRLDVPVSFASDAPAVATAGASVTGQAIGRTRVMVTTAAGQTPVYVSVVPRGTLVANFEGKAYVVELDGSGLRRFNEAFTDPITRDVRWITGGGAVWLEGASVYVSTPSGGGHPLGFGYQGLEPGQPRASRDGQWVFFNVPRRGYLYSIDYPVIRIRVDGTDRQEIGDGIIVPSPSPTGDRVVYTEDGYIRLRNLEPGAGWQLRGGWPEWSYGDSIAYIDGGRVHLVDRRAADP